VEKQARRPNIVFVFADQMRTHAMGCMGNKQLLTKKEDIFFVIMRKCLTEWGLKWYNQLSFDVFYGQFY
jgi:hypothetical protein